MLEFFQSLDQVTQAFLATCLTWGLTALGSSLVFLFKGMNKKFLNIMLGFAAGVMIAASFWSLLLPAIEMTLEAGVPSWLPAAAGFLGGGIFLWGIDKTLPHLHLGLPESKAEGVRTKWSRTTLLVLAITLHNIPEGLAVGVAFGAVAVGLPSATLVGAIALAIGIGIQNFPEGAAVSIPLRQEGFSRLKSFWYGQLSAVVEPIAAVIGAATVIAARSILPYALAFAAGAMIYVVVEELIPESQHGGDTHWATAGAMLGFVVMMVLDVALG
jgi:ZIP family zinc transporter